MSSERNRWSSNIILMASFFKGNQNIIQIRALQEWLFGALLFVGVVKLTANQSRGTSLDPIFRAALLLS